MSTNVVPDNCAGGAGDGMVLDSASSLSRPTLAGNTMRAAREARGAARLGDMANSSSAKARPSRSG